MGGEGGAPGELDLTGEPIDDASKPLPTPHEAPWDPEPGREKVRAGLAAALLAVLTVTVVLAFALLAFGALTQDETKSLLDPIFPSLVALTGSAIGFYFGGKTRG